MKNEPSQNATSDFKTLGEFLEAWRIQAQVRGQDIVEQVPISMATYTNWEGSKTVPPLALEGGVISVVKIFAKAAQEAPEPLIDEALSLAQSDRTKSKQQLLADRGKVQGRISRVESVGGYTRHSEPKRHVIVLKNI